jgi:hypothetical protein
MATATLKATILQGLRDSLGGLGFKKRGSTFYKEVGDVIHLVSLQASQSSSASRLRVTVNLAVAVPGLGGQIDDAWSAQWRERIGALLPEPQDRWWNASSPQEAEAVAQELTQSLSQYGLPAQARVSSTKDLLQLWESGKSPGLTSVQASRYVDQLRRSAV